MNKNKTQFFTNEAAVNTWLKEFACIHDYQLLEDLSVDVFDNVDLTNRKISYLPVQFRRVEGYFDISNNLLTSLLGSPKWVDESFYAPYNQLRSLEHCPEFVGNSFYAYNNTIKSVDYFPTHVGNSIDLSDNLLTDSMYMSENSFTEVKNYRELVLSALKEKKEMSQAIVVVDKRDKTAKSKKSLTSFKI